MLPQLFEYEARQAKRVCERLRVLEAQIEELDQLIKKECKEDKDIQRLQTIPGVGDKTALAFAAYVGDGKRFNIWKRSSKLCRAGAAGRLFGDD